MLLPREGLASRLQAEYAAAQAGRGRVVLVSGEAGAGKTVLVREALPGAVEGFCEPLTTPRPLGPFRDLAERLWPGAAPPRSPTALGSRLLRRLADPGPALVVEDAHWIDSASLDVLRHVGRRIAPTRGLLVVTARDEALAGGALRPVLGELGDELVRVAVPPLDADEIRALADGSGLAVEDVLRLTAGNALLVSQLLAAPAGRPAARLVDPVAARLALLTPAAREAAQLLSVVPGRVPAALVGPEWACVDELAAAGFVTADGASVTFRHELVRLAVEQTVPAGRARQLHATVLERLQAADGSEPAAVAHHARAAHRTDVARRADVAAARRAAAFGSHHEAARHLRRAAADPAPDDERAGILVALAEREAAIARDDEALAAAREAVRLSSATDDHRLRSRAVRTLARLEPSETEAHDLARTALALCRPDERSVERAAALAQLASDRMIARDLGAAVTHAEQAVALAAELGDVGAEVMAANSLGSALLLRGDPAGERPLRRAVHLAAAAGLDSEVGRAYANLVSAAAEARLYGIAAAAQVEAERYFAERDLDGMGAYTRAWAARCLVEQADLARATDLLAALTARPRLSAITTVMTHYLTARCLARTGGGDPTAALDAAERIAGRTGSLQRIAPVAAVRAEAAWLAGRTIDTDRLEPPYRLALQRESPWTVGELGFWLWRAGALDALPTGAAEPYRRHVAGDHEAAAAAWAALGCRYEAADALADSDDAALVESALITFRRLGAVPAARRAAHRLRALGVRSVPRGPRAATASRADGLTAREADVRDHLERGATDAEIAAQLHLSVRTVEHHVSSILRKTGAHTRRDLRR